MRNHKDFAIQLAQKAGKIIKKNFSLGMNKEWKSNDTPVTKSDLAVNNLVLNEIRKFYPDYSIIAEEKSDLRKSEMVWVCDPIDGTTPFSHGYPIFTFSLALLKDGAPIMGILFDPILDRLVFAEKNKGAYLNGKRTYVSKAKSLERTVLDIGAENKLLDVRTELLEKYNPWVSVLYSTSYASLMVALGEFVAEIFEYDNPWDGAAEKIVVEEAGGKVTDILGNEQRYDRRINGYVASNGLLHNEILHVIKSVLSKRSK